MKRFLRNIGRKKNFPIFLIGNVNFSLVTRMLMEIILIVYFAIVLFILWAISVVAILGIWIMGLRIAAIVCILI